MVNFNLVFLVSFFLSFGVHAKMDRITSEGYLGEKNIDLYSERFQPLIFQDIYRGTMTFEDELYFQNFFDPYLFQKEKDYSFFMKSELNGALVCPNELLSSHFEDIRFSYRLITLSYLLEGQWHNKLISDKLRLKNGCAFDIRTWPKTCRPKTQHMKDFLSKLEQYLPHYDESLPDGYSKNDWWKELKNKNFKWYSQYRIDAFCGPKCEEDKLNEAFRKSCEIDQNLMTLICSEEDEIYGLSMNRDAYSLLGQSNIINTFNKSGEAVGCLRRFSEVMSHKEVRYDIFNQLFPSIQSFLRSRYQERFLQGRVFFYGSAKEFEEKGLKNLYVKDQPLKIEKIPEEPKVTVVEPIKKEVPKVEPLKPVVTIDPTEVKETPKEIRQPVKSALLLAAEFRKSQNLPMVEVDMTKLKYDYVFSLNMINNLSERLKTFMTRDALKEMMDYDKLGTKEGPVPFLFLKFMIDMNEHQGLWNLISVMGNRFYVSNEIDESFKPAPEFIELQNNQSTNNTWQISVLRP